jgi:SpoIID/LytB domain protein
MGCTLLERDRRLLRVLLRARMTATASTYHRLRALLNRPRAAAPALAALAALALSGAPATASARPPTLLIEGAGEGHGVGMSQDGALGYAQHGWTYAQILAHYYSGTALALTSTNRKIRVLVGSRVVRVPIERYVRGVISAEVPSSWPMAALEAQAIASRTYALTDHAGGARFDVYSDTRSQVYEGVAAETKRTNAAVTATSGQIVTYAGRPAITYFFAGSGGMTENVEDSFLGAQAQPWLRGVPDAYETPATKWRLSLGFAAAATRLSGLVKGSLKGVEVLTRGASPRIVAARVLGSRGASRVSGPELAAHLGLNSAWAYFSVKSGRTVKREPDRSGQSPLGPPAPESPPAVPPPPTTATPVSTPQGGTTGAGMTASVTGGASAG